MSDSRYRQTGPARLRPFTVEVRENFSQRRKCRSIRADFTRQIQHAGAWSAIRENLTGNPAGDSSDFGRD